MPDSYPVQPLDAVVTHHVDGFRSGVARFNEVLAARLSVPLLTLGEVAASGFTHPLLSFKVAELDAEAEQAIGWWVARGAAWDVFLHAYEGRSLERLLVSAASRVLCGNDEIGEAVKPLRPDAEVVWSPGLLLDGRSFPETDLSIFSFGMAHKLRLDMFRRLRVLLDESGLSYAVYVSAANHETTTLGDAESVFRDLHEVFPGELYFLGNLSDVAVTSWLRTTTFFASFFPGGARANNTSVASAMEHGAVVVTNLDRHSPPWLRHLETVVDLERCESLPLDAIVRAGISARAAAAMGGLGWDALAACIGRHGVLTA